MEPRAIGQGAMRALPPHPGASDTPDELRAAVRAAVRRCDLETATRLTIWLAGSLVDHGRPAEAILELQTAARQIRLRLGSSVHAARLLWPVLATLARRIDAHGDRDHARALAVQADREAIRCSSMAGRAAARALLLHLSRASVPHR